MSLKETIEIKNNTTYLLQGEDGLEFEIEIGKELKIKGRYNDKSFFNINLPNPVTVKRDSKITREVPKLKSALRKIGHTFINNTGHLCEVIDYISSGKVIVLFKEYNVEVSTSWKSCENGSVKVPNEVHKVDRIGQRFQNKEGYWYEIVDYVSSKEVTIKFDNQDELYTFAYGAVSSGGVKNPYHPNVFGVGYIGVGEFKSAENGKMTKEYRDWSQILHRCYYDTYMENKPKYFESEICEEWKNFQTFAKWHKENYYIIEGEVMALDKDLFGDKTYSPDCCVFLPTKINSALAHMNSFINKKKYFEDLVIDYQGLVPDKVIAKLKEMIENM